jgi:CelD/BcsL family acetyltransferase involved in cellulose biosynthesis
VTLTNHPGFDMPPVAEATGPFCTQDFLTVVASYDDGEEILAASHDAFLALRGLDDTILFAGDGDVTDYHSPHGEGSEALIARLAEETSVDRFLLDSLPEEAAKPLVAGLTHAGWAVDTRTHEVAAVLHLPDSVEQYMTELGKKERHEVRRKRRRYERMVGEVRHETHAGPGWAFDEFLRLHAAAEGDKGRFMTPERRALFADLAELDGWRFDLLRTDDDTAAAIVFGYADGTGYYLYNSAYEPADSDASPGVVLLGAMIETAIAEGRARFDFLKGDETYKFRLGAQRRPLTEISATREPTP